MPQPHLTPRARTADDLKPSRFDREAGDKRVVVTDAGSSGELTYTFTEERIGVTVEVKDNHDATIGGLYLGNDQERAMFALAVSPAFESVLAGFDAMLAATYLNATKKPKGGPDEILKIAFRDHPSVVDGYRAAVAARNQMRRDLADAEKSSTGRWEDGHAG